MSSPETMWTQYPQPAFNLLVILSKRHAEMVANGSVPKVPRAEFIERLMQDPATHGIAQNLQMSAADYAHFVAEFAYDPAYDPEFLLAEDEDIRALGHEPFTEAMLEQVVIRAAALAQASDTQASGFAVGPSAPVDLAPKGADPLEVQPSEELLKEVKFRRPVEP